MKRFKVELRLLKLIGRYRKSVIIIFICMLLSSGLNLLIPIISQHIMDDGFIGGDRMILMKLVFFSAFLYALDSGIGILKHKKRVDVFAKIYFSLSERAFLHLMKLKIDYFENKNYAEVLNNINMDINNMASIANENFFFVITQIFNMAGGTIGLMIIDFRMTILVLLYIPVKYFVMKYFAKRNKKIIDHYIEDARKYAGWFGDTLGGVREIKLFGLMEVKHEEFAEKQGKVVSRQKRMNMLTQWNSIADIMMLHILTSFLYITGANLVFQRALSIGSVFAFITYSIYVTGPISAILNIGYLLSGVIPSAKRYYEFIDLEDEEHTVKGEKEAVWGELEVKEVSFSYDGSKEVLSNACIQFPMGSKTALIGQNGAGKTTLIHLLIRMNLPANGTILLSGQDIKEFELHSYRKMFSVVSQQIYLFNDTIRNNICLYQQVDDERLLQICQESGLGSFLNEVTLDYVVGQNGAMLSGGQKQKIALARALIQNRPIIIFDEATSSTDTHSEMQINSLVNTRLKEKTVIVITHRKEILSVVDRIFVLQDGKIERLENHNSGRY